MVSKTRTHIRVQAKSAALYPEFEISQFLGSIKSPRRSFTNLQHIISTFGKPTIIMLGSAHLQSELVLSIVSNHNKKAKLKVQIKLTSRKLSRCDSTTSCLRSKHSSDGVTLFRSSTRSSMMRSSYHISTTIGPGVRQVLIGF